LMELPLPNSKKRVKLITGHLACSGIPLCSGCKLAKLNPHKELGHLQ